MATTCRKIAEKNSRHGHPKLICSSVGAIFSELFHEGEQATAVMDSVVH
jgi:hypothetical protein